MNLSQNGILSNGEDTMNFSPETDEELEQLIKQANDEGSIVQKTSQQNG